MKRLLSFFALLALAAQSLQPAFASSFSPLPGGGGSGTVTSVGVTTANGVSGTVANPTTTPAISVTLGAITPSSVAASGTVTGSNLSGTNTGNQTITLTSDVTGTGTGSFATTIAAKAVTYAKIQDVAASSLVGNPTGGATAASEITLGPGFTFSGSTLYGAANHPGYVTGTWYSTVPYATVAAGVAVPINTIKLVPFTISKPITISALGARVTTAATSGNFQLAVYANAAATGRPTGNALCTTGNISSASTGAISATASCTGALTPGTYWGGVNSDNSTAVFQITSGAALTGAYLIGSTTLANITASSTNVSYNLSVAQTFGTWPDLTSGSFTEQNSSTFALVFMKAQ